MKVKTVGDLVAALQQMPQDAPVIVGCHYDNDNGLKDNVQVYREYIDHADSYAGDNFYIQTEPPNPGFWAVTIT